jgi:exportin-1
MLEKLEAQVNPEGSAWSWNNLNTLCWAIGSISGAMSEEEEKRFLVTVIKDLLSLCEEKRGKDNKAVIASNIMYVVGQYPRFLRAHWKFLKTVVNKLFEFMHELHPGVQDMACETFLKIAQKCKRKFVTVQQNETQPFIMELADMIPSIIIALEPHQVHTFYEAAACMLSERAIPGVDPEMRNASLMKLLTGPGPQESGYSMAFPNQTWSAIMGQARHTEGESLKTAETARELQKFLKTNQRVCSAVGPLYVVELGRIYHDLMNVYTVYADTQKVMVDTQGEISTHNSLFKQLRSVKKETLRLLTTFVEKCGDPEAPPATVAQSVLPLLLQPTTTSVLGDYNRSIPAARDAEVLKLFSTCIEKLPMNEAEGGQAVPRIMEALFASTLQMIAANHEDFPELRLQFFQLLKAINQHSFPSLFAIPQEVRKNVVDAVAFAIKHTERNVAETGLDIMYELLQNVNRHEHIAQEFYQQFLLQLIQEVLYVMTDRLHKSGIKMHSMLLRDMLHLVEQGKVTVPLFDPATYAPGTTNPGFLKEFIGNLILTQFPNLTQPQVVQFVTGLFDLTMDVPTFKQHLRDFLVSLREFSDGDNKQLFAEETEQQRQAAAAQEMARRQAVPGMMNPYEVADDGMS